MKSVPADYFGRIRAEARGWNAEIKEMSRIEVLYQTVLILSVMKFV